MKDLPVSFLKYTNRDSHMRVEYWQGIVQAQTRSMFLSCKKDSILNPKSQDFSDCSFIIKGDKSCLTKDLFLVMLKKLIMA
jgi:hypothetical protein